MVTFEKRVTLANPYQKLPYYKGTAKQVKSINLALVKKAGVGIKAEAGRSIASSCDFTKFCKLNVPNLKPGQNAEVYGNYTVLADGVLASNHVKSWTLINGDGQEIKLTCGIQSATRDMSCQKKLTRIKIKNMGPFIEKMLEVKVAVAE